MKKNNKGFTLVELIVVLVILAILAAVLVPALLGYIDKAKKRKDMNAAEAAYIAAQAVYSEYYGLGKDRPADSDMPGLIAGLTDLDASTFTVTITQKATTTTKTDKNEYIITKFVYKTTDNYEYTWQSGTWKTMDD